MPLYDDQVDQIVNLETSLQQLAEQFGPLQLKQALIRQELLPDVQQIAEKPRILLLSEAVEHYFESDAFTDLAIASQEVYRYEINMFVHFCHKMKGHDPNIKEVSTPIFLKEYLSPVKKKNTRSKKAAFLRSFLRETLDYFFQQGIEGLKKTLEVKPDKKRTEPRAFEKKQIDELLTNVKLGRESHRNFTILWTFLGTGTRLNELCGLQVGDVNPSRQELFVRGKGDKESKQPCKITKFSLDVLCSYIHFRYNDLKSTPNYYDLYVFSDDKGVSPLHDSTVQKMITSLIAEAKTINESDKNCYQLSVHSLRHSYALYLLESGVNIYTIKELMRHTWLSSTEIYLQMFDKMLVEAIDKHPLGQLKISDFFGSSVYG
ncbi:tyrosine-type recombinase/integrase [Paenibacillus urinalis]|uniref:Tyrosine-type recombinase/integrase n=1 Tax=Paenibacillus urinalis TaxID=521520 RepID=A0AAX3N0D5_9BACL|nr:tyrosine-type recombinase/integrase [Paenibacillus urinalis]WDH83298.1 tyrosine-type recombinase/integrase [Paenibacillus urinalis]